MKKRMKLCSLALASLMLVGLTACGEQGAGETGGGSISDATAGLSDVTLWGMPGPEKVYQDIDKDNEIYAAYKTAAQVDLIMAKGEKEGAHVVISADKKAEYDVTGSALVCGDNTISAENVEIFVEKYVRVSSINEGYRALPIANYPDAIVPIAKIKKAKENVVEAGNNQGIYVRVNVPVGQPAGVYTGSVTVKIGKDTTAVPVRVTVLDVEVPAENHARSLFTVGWSWYKGELDTSQEMLDKYYEALFDYRLNPGFIIDTAKNQNFKDADLPDFIERAYTYMQDVRCNTVALPFRTAGLNVDTGLMTATLQALLEKSEEEDFDMFAKSIYYLTFIDEPEDLNIVDRAVTVCQTYNNTLQAFAAEHTDSKFHDSILKLPNVLTNQYNGAFDGTNVVYCPKFDHYDGEEQRAQYDDLSERWWYGCVFPNAPYPTYHTDDIWLSARLVGWMQAEYDVVGNLFWATDVYSSYDNNAGYQEIEDYYEGSAARYGSINGDGYLFYPGKKYGIDGPVGSLRLESIRDGLEEYELLRNLRNSYAEIASKVESEHAPDFQSMMTMLAEELYGGTQVSATTEEFTQSRDELLTMALINSTCGFSIVDYSDNGRGTITYKFIAEEDVVVKNHGETLDGTAAGGGYKAYEVVVQLVNPTNTISLTFEKGDAVYEYNVNCGGAVSVITGKDLDTTAFEQKSGTTVSIVGEELKIELAGGLGIKEQSAVLIGSNVASIDANTNKVVLRIRYEGSDNQPELTIMAKYANRSAYRDLTSVKLAKGENVITLDFSSIDWSSNGSLEKLAFAFYYDGMSAFVVSQKTLYISEMVVYKK